MIGTCANVLKLRAAIGPDPLRAIRLGLVVAMESARTAADDGDIVLPVAYRETSLVLNLSLIIIQENMGLQTLVTWA